MRADTVNHKIDTLPDWELHTEANAAKDWLYVVEVFATWCGPTDAIQSTVKKLHTDYLGRRLKFLQVRTEVAGHHAHHATLNVALVLCIPCAGQCRSSPRSRKVPHVLEANVHALQGVRSATRRLAPSRAHLPMDDALCINSEWRAVGNN